MIPTQKESEEIFSLRENIRTCQDLCCCCCCCHCTMLY